MAQSPAHILATANFVANHYEFSSASLTGTLDVASITGAPIGWLTNRGPEPVSMAASHTDMGWRLTGRVVGRGRTEITIYLPDVVVSVPGRTDFVGLAVVATCDDDHELLGGQRQHVTSETVAGVASVVQSVQDGRGGR